MKDQLVRDCCITKKENKVDIIYENCTIQLNLVARPEFILKLKECYQEVTLLDLLN